LGADDYVVKPFSVRELMVRVKNVLRRTNPQTVNASPNLIQIDDLSIDLARCEATWNGTPLKLTALELRLLYTLAQHAGQVLSREQLLEQVWGYDYFGDLRAVDAAVKRLRSRLREVSPDNEIITTVRGMGYKLSIE
jgi:two-component system response regulator VicR